jgi:hypothetical protein
MRATLAGDNMAGTQLACPECGITLRLAGPVPEGKRIRCPKCDVIFAVPAPEEFTAQPPMRPRPFRETDDNVPARRRPRDDEDDDAPPRRRPRLDDEEDEDYRPWRKKRAKSQRGLVVALVAGGAGLVAMATLVVVLVIVLKKGEDKPAGQKPAAGPPPAGGHEFKSAAGRLKVTFPQAPKQVNQVAAGINFTMFVYEEKEGAFMIGYADMPIPPNEPPLQIQNRLVGAQAGALANVGGVATAQRDIKFQGKFPGREFEGNVTRPQGIVRARMIMSGTRLYQVIVLGRPGLVNSPAADRFFNSFTLE